MKISPTYKATLQFEVVLGVDAPERLAQHIEERLNSYSDGRYPFEVEMIHEGLRRTIEASVERAIDTGFRLQHGDIMVSTATGKPVKNIRRSRSATSFAAVLTEQVMKNVSVYVHGKATCPSFEQVLPGQDDQR